MKPIGGYDNAKPYTEFTKLPAGAYIVGILDAEEVSSDKGSRLVLKFDICDGEFKNYYTEQFKNSQFEDAKYKGNFSIFLPRDDGSEDDVKTLRRLKTSMNAIEDSNPGFHWDWDEKELKGKKVGMIFQDKEWSYNGKTGFTAQPYGLRAMQDVNDGSCKIPAPKYLNGQQPARADTSTDFTEIDDDGDLPF